MQASALAVAPDWVVASCVRQLRQLYGSQTAPFLAPFADYGAEVQRARELEVRLLQLEKEGAELRDENAALDARLKAADEAAAAATAAQLEEARAALGRAERELGQLYRDKAALREEVVTANTQLLTTRSSLESTTTQLAQARAEVSALREQLASLAAAAEAETAARLAAASEAAAALTARDGALAEAERLRRENAVLVRRLLELKEGEAGRMNDLNRMHEELLEQAARMRQEAEMDRQATELIRQKAVAQALSGVMPLATASAAPPAGPPLATAAAAPAAGAAVGMMAPPVAAPPPTAVPAAAGAGAGADSVGGGMSGEWVMDPTGPVSPPAPPPAAAAAPPPVTAASSLSVPTSLRAVMGLLGRKPSSEAAVAAVGGGTAAGGALTSAAATVAGLYDERPLRPTELREPSRLAVRVVPTAHKGGCTSLAPQSPGHFVASCGADRAVALWDVSLLPGAGLGGGSILGGGGGGGWGGGGGLGGSGPAVLLSGMTGGVNDCAFTCDAAQVVAAGADRSLHVWDAPGGRHRHTLTGHTAAVTAVAASPLDARLAVSVSEDRSFKLWDLGKGFAVRSIPCAKMPLCLTLSRDGNTIVTGHLDGSVMLWDIRQCRAGAAAPLLEARDQPHPVVSLATVPPDDTMLALASKDGALRLWDFRGAALMRLMKHPTFALGTSGGSGRPRCRLGISPDGRLLAAGGADGGVWVWDVRSGMGGGGAAGGGAGRGAEPRQLRFLGSGFPSPAGSAAPAGPPAHRDAVVATAFSSDSTALVSADKAGGLAFWLME